MIHTRDPHPGPVKRVVGLALAAVALLVIAALVAYVVTR